MARATRSDVTGHFDSSRRTPQGGLKVPAFMTRTGVLTYRQPDGSVVRELRHPDEVFKVDSMATLEGAPVTIGHPGKVAPENWGKLSVGHVGDQVIPKDDKFVAGTLRVQDARAVAAVEKGDLLELSCGYDCDVVPESGEYKGEKYDAKQVNISYNHVALLPRGGGRAGQDVRIRFDGLTEDEEAKTDQKAPVAKLLDMDPEKLIKDLTDAKAEAQKARQDAVDLKAALDKAEGERDALKAQVATLSDPKRQDADLDRLVSFREDARVILGADVQLSGKDERTVMAEALAKCDATFKATDSMSADYLRGRFDTAVAATKVGAASNSKLGTTIEEVTRKDAETKDPVAEARARNDKRSADAWKGNK